MDDITNTHIEQMAPENNKDFSEKHHHFILSLILIGAIIGGGYYLMKYKPWNMESAQEYTNEEYITTENTDIQSLDSDLQAIDIETLPQ